MLATSKLIFAGSLLLASCGVQAGQGADIMSALEGAWSASLALDSHGSICWRRVGAREWEERRYYGRMSGGGELIARIRRTATGELLYIVRGGTDFRAVLWQQQSPMESVSVDVDAVTFSSDIVVLSYRVDGDVLTVVERGTVQRYARANDGSSSCPSGFEAR